MGFDQDAVDVAVRARLPVTEEIERGETSLLVRAIPLLDGDEIAGVVRARPRRHRPPSPRPDAAVEGRHDPRDPPPGEEQPADDRRAAAAAGPAAAVTARRRRRSRSRSGASARSRSCTRRCRATSRDVVRFDDIVQPLVRVVAGDGRRRPTPTCASSVVGDAGVLPGDVATPLAVVLNELMQNAVDHAFPPVDGESSGHVTVRVVAQRRRRSRSTSSTTASACRRASPSSGRAGSGCRSCRRS